MKSLRIAGLTANAVGAAGSFALTLYVGLRSGAPVLVPLFAVWVLSPFGALWLGHIASKRWLDITRAALYAAMLIVSAGSLAAYTGRVLTPPNTQGAFVFVIVPPLSWVLAVVAVSAGALAARVQKPPRKDPVLMPLRDRLLQSKPEQLGFHSKGGEAYVAVMEIAFPDAVVSLVTASTGDARLYFSSGGGAIGGITHESVRNAATAFVRAAGETSSLEPTTDFAHPAAGQVRFFARNAAGVHAASASEEALRSGAHPLSSLYASGHEIITQLRLVNPSQ